MSKMLGTRLGYGLLLGSCRSTTENHTAIEQTTQTTNSSTVSELEKTVLATHDSAMADMSELLRLQKAMKQQLASLATQTPSTELTRQQEQGVAIGQALEKADQAMMNWMHTYNGDTLFQLNQQQGLLYLKDQQQKVNAMRKRMLESIRSAKTYLP